eukprot:192637-Amphidinium_carterae.1
MNENAKHEDDGKVIKDASYTADLARKRLEHAFFHQNYCQHHLASYLVVKTAVVFTASSTSKQRVIKRIVNAKMN